MTIGAPHGYDGNVVRVSLTDGKMSVEVLSSSTCSEPLNCPYASRSAWRITGG
jgi:hypothetical protein